MRVLLTATSYPRSEEDWQSIFIRRMCDALAGSAAVDLRVWAPQGPLSTHASSALNEGDRRFLAKLANAGGAAHLLRTAPLRGTLSAVELLFRLRLAMRRERGRTDVLHINWLQCVLAAGGMRLPMLVTVLGSDLQLLATPWIRMLVRRALRGRRVLVCPNAPWMLPLLRSALAVPASAIRCIPFGLDPFWYAVERHPSGTPHEWLTVLRVTPRKIGKLFEWTRDVDPSRHCFHLFGPMQESVAIPPWIRYHGPVTPGELAGRWYPRASGMISLSEHDEGRPQVLLEAMAAGLPVVCSRIPAHTDLIETLATGQLVGSAEDFHDALRSLEGPGEARLQAERGRARILREFGTWDDCAQRYVDAYQHLVDPEPAPCGS